MGIGTSLFLIAVGAIMDFAVKVTTNGFNLHVIGLILMVVGIVGALLSLAFWSSWGGGFTRGQYHRTRRVTRDPNGTYVEEHGTI